MLTLIVQLVFTMWVQVLRALLVVSCVNQSRSAKVDRSKGAGDAVKDVTSECCFVLYNQDFRLKFADAGYSEGVADIV